MAVGNFKEYEEKVSASESSMHCKRAKLEMKTEALLQLCCSNKQNFYLINFFLLHPSTLNLSIFTISNKTEVL